MNTFHWKLSNQTKVLRKATSKALLLIFFATVKTYAQPTLTAATTNPTVGLSHNSFYISQFLPGTAGASQSWDFSTQTYGAAIARVFEACNATNNCTPFPGTTIVRSVGSNNYDYYSATSTAFGATGYRYSGVNYQFQNTSDGVRYPMSYGNNFADNFNQTFTSSGVTWYETGVDSVSADAWGTLKTPAGTFPNTLRVKIISTWKDSSNTGGVPTINTIKSYFYKWYDVSHKYELFGAYNETMTPQTGSPTTLNSSYYNSVSPNSASDQYQLIGCEIVPNPAMNGEVAIVISLNTSSYVSCSLSDISGRTLVSVPSAHFPAGTNKLQVRTTGIPSGIYIMRVAIDNSIVTRKLVIE